MAARPGIAAVKFKVGGDKVKGAEATQLGQFETRTARPLRRKRAAGPGRAQSPPPKDRSSAPKGLKRDGPRRKALFGLTLGRIRSFSLDGSNDEPPVTSHTAGVAGLPLAFGGFVPQHISINSRGPRLGLTATTVYAGPARVALNPTLGDRRIGECSRLGSYHPANPDRGSRPLLRAVQQDATPPKWRPVPPAAGFYFRDCDFRDCEIQRDRRRYPNQPFQLARLALPRHRTRKGMSEQRFRRKGYARLFQILRVLCRECHAPANPLDLPLVKPMARRREGVELGVDCVFCHVPEQGIVEPGRSDGAPHEMPAHERFLDPPIASTMVCAPCHEEQGDCSKTVTAWRRSVCATRGISCLDCHMPEVPLPSVAARPAQEPRSHRFFGDKDPGTLEKALDGAIIVTPDGKAVVPITNDRVGHSLPASGIDALVGQVSIEDGLRAVIEQRERLFGWRELILGYLDFWPFRRDTSIPAGETRTMQIALPAVPGTIAVEFRHRDWFAIPNDDRS